MTLEVALAVFCLAQPPAADLPLAFDHSFTGGAVIQRDVTTEVWGTAPVGTKTVAIKIDLATARDGVVVDDAGHWAAVLPAHSASYDCMLTVTADSLAAVSIPVAFGDVILCGKRTQRTQASSPPSPFRPSHADIHMRMLRMTHAKPQAGRVTWGWL